MSARPAPARTPAALLQQTRSLKALFDQAQRIAQLQSQVDAQLQPAARPHCRVASWRDGVLVLVVNDANWATRLRYQEKRLQQSLTRLPEFAGLTRIRFKMAPDRGGAERQRATPTLSANAAQSIRATAEGIADDRLREALERLASHALDNSRKP